MIPTNWKNIQNYFDNIFNYVCVCVYHGHWKLYGDLDVILNFPEDWFLFRVDLITSEEIVENAQSKEERL